MTAGTSFTFRSLIGPLSPFALRATRGCNTFQLYYFPWRHLRKRKNLRKRKKNFDFVVPRHMRRAHASSANAEAQLLQPNTERNVGSLIQKHTRDFAAQLIAMEVDDDLAPTAAETHPPAPRDPVRAVQLLPPRGLDIQSLGARETLERQLEAVKRLQAVYKVGPVLQGTMAFEPACDRHWDKPLGRALDRPR
jgi:hypothetical protein